MDGGSSAPRRCSRQPPPASLTASSLCEALAPPDAQLPSFKCKPRSQLEQPPTPILPAPKLFFHLDSFYWPGPFLSTTQLRPLRQPSLFTKPSHLPTPLSLGLLLKFIQAWPGMSGASCSGLSFAQDLRFFLASDMMGQSKVDFHSTVPTPKFRLRSQQEDTSLRQGGLRPYPVSSDLAQQEVHVIRPRRGQRLKQTLS